MTIQIPNPGTGNGATGDNEYVMWSKVKDNFNDQSNAASRLVGTGTGQVPQSQDVFGCAYGAAGIKSADAAVFPSCNDLPIGSRYYINNKGLADAPPLSNAIVSTISNFGTVFQFSSTRGEVGITARVFTSTWSPWVPISTNVLTYTTTTAAGANVVVDSTGKLMRSTSSERYKDIIADLELDDEAYKNAMQLAPIVYRSTADADNPSYHYYSFSAEALGAFDPAFTLWRETETVTDDDGNTIEQPLAERVAEGLNINALLAFNHAIAIKQDEMIKALTARVNDLAQKLEA